MMLKFHRFICIRKLVPSLVLMLKNLVMGFSQEHDVGGITDPFLQACTMLLTLRMESDSIA